MCIDPSHGGMASCRFAGQRIRMDRTELPEFINKLPDSVKIIYGHKIGSCQNWIRNPFWSFTFLRDPIRQKFSQYHYNFRRNAQKNRPAPFWKPVLNGCSYRNGQLITLDETHFKEWLIHQKPHHPSMTGSLIENHTLNRPDEYELNETDLENAKSILDAFSFVGITESFDEDSAFIFNKMKFYKFFPDQKVAPENLIIKNKDRITEWVQNECQIDQKLYAYGKMLNRNFKNNHPDFLAEVNKLADKRRYLNTFGPMGHKILAKLIKLKRKYLK